MASDAGNTLGGARQLPFPILTDSQSGTHGRLGERLDAFRKERLAKHDFLTMTDMYNVPERLRKLEPGAKVPPLSDKEKDIHQAGLEQIRTLRDVLAEAEAPLPADVLAALFKGMTTSKRKDRAEQVLETLVATGAARESEGRYFLPR